MRYTMRDVGLPYYKVMAGRRWVGRVYRHAGGEWRCAIGKVVQGTGATAREAFGAGVAKYLGHASESALRAANAATAARNRAARARGRALADRLVAGDRTVFDELLNALTR